MENSPKQFRGKRLYTGEWKYGFYYFSMQEKRHIILTTCDGLDIKNDVDPSTVGQFTGLLDKNGKQIFEGDVVKRIVTRYDWENELDESSKVEEISFIEYKGHSFWVEDEFFGYEGEGLWEWYQMEVVGNIYENSELLK